MQSAAVAAFFGKIFSADFIGQIFEFMRPLVESSSGLHTLLELLPH